MAFREINKRPVRNKKKKSDSTIYFLSKKNHHKRQKRIAKYFLTIKPKVLILSGSVRSGKTYTLIMLFLMKLMQNQGKGKKYLIGGTTQSSIWRNVLTDIEELLGKKIKLDRSGCFTLFGNKIYVIEGGLAGTNEKVRGFTLSGALLNEGTTLDTEYIQEVQNRLSDDSENNGWLMIDTNPDSLQSYVYQNFVKNDGQMTSSGKVVVKWFNCTLVHNPYVSEDYKETLRLSTPSGHMYQRMIEGKWVNSSGLVYKDYDEDKHIVDKIPADERIVKYVGGIDWGWNHPGAFVVFAITNKGNYYCVREVCERFKLLDWWIEQVKRAYKDFRSFDVYCDTAEPDKIYEMNQRGIYALNANKSVISGITHIAKLLRVNKIFFLRDVWKAGHKEMGLYCWKEDKNGVKDEVSKINDDVLNLYRVHRKKIA